MVLAKTTPCIGSYVDRSNAITQAFRQMTKGFLRSPAWQNVRLASRSLEFGDQFLSVLPVRQSQFRRKLNPSRSSQLVANLLHCYRFKTV